MSVGPVPGSAIERMAERDDLDPLEAEAFYWIMREVDNHVRAKAAEQLAKDTAKNNKR